MKRGDARCSSVRAYKKLMTSVKAESNEDDVTVSSVPDSKRAFSCLRRNSCVKDPITTAILFVRTFQGYRG